MKTEKIIIGLPIAEYTLEQLEKMTPKQRYAYGLSRVDAVSYDDVEEFLDAINDGLDTSNFAWFEHEIEIGGVLI
jgi:hypothetical protein